MASMQKREENSWFFLINVGHRPDGTRDRRTKTIKVEDPTILKSPRKLIVGEHSIKRIPSLNTSGHRRFSCCSII
ncbi:hypothetical protein SAMN04488542_101486 [Fontibacillus panacisegetis]|uniref:Uncharacterized protein n=1 Tax=Fontibacillus panacisegetis TaxID=670482 RepID=A0A1G7F633_9BACL|nr:hypothetical protein [Fontibacillus panacisegetis]SDE71349.1 hypothetical protein SAMN04488542_101486 [Fontibacillus panacisegetis]